MVGIGASARGSEAISGFLKEIPTQTEMSFVFVQHLDPTHESQLPELLGRVSRLPVVAIKDGMAAGLKDYLSFLEKNPQEIDLLFHDLLINVTSFFRDQHVFEALRKKVFPKISRGKSADAPIRVWVSGCSTGEEVYSSGICLHGFLGRNSGKRSIQIFGADASEALVSKARLGIYLQSISANISPERLRRYFGKSDGGVANRQIYSRRLCFREAERGGRSAVLEVGPDQLPELIDLSGADASEESVPGLSLFVASGRFPIARLRAELRGLRRQVQELEDSRARYAFHFERAPIGYVTIDGKGVIRQADSAFANLVQRTPQQLLNIPFSLLVSRDMVEVFQRLHPPDAYSGTGIGLALAARGIERIGGRAGLDSKSGAGSRFWFELARA